ncbi:MAG: Tex-like N-terminal domain-containing protein [Putridiphycobacter sp.]|nr:Tex-like N-terminal domain-containing protein [Putridiphycobacter sp.]
MLVNKYIGQLTKLPEKGILAVLKLSDEGATIPFISRYRKEQTGNLDELEIERVIQLADQFKQIVKRKKFIIETISATGDLSVTLNEKISACFDLNVLEDLYLPYKKKKQTKADTAKKSGLLGLAKTIMAQELNKLDEVALRYVKGPISSIEEAYEGAGHIMAEWITENPIVREKLRHSFYNFSILTATKIKKAEDPLGKYKNFYDFSQSGSNCPPYRFLAILRGENEKVLKVKIQPNADYNLGWMERFYIKRDNDCSELVKDAIKVAYKKQLVPSLELETKAHFKALADEKSIQNFTKNIEQLLLSPPVGAKRVLAIDPGFRTGCKIVCLSENGDLLHNTTIFPHPPQKEKSKAISKIAQLVEQYKIEAIAIGDGTAGRETENLIKHIAFKNPPLAYVVREDGASIYSASKVAREEFPDYDVTVRGAVSIGRRLCDPLAELVKIDARSLGVGQYQHDVNQTLLKAALDLTVEKAVNKVGVNVNTASKYLLSYVSGIGPKLAESIVEFRTKNGRFKNRASLKLVPRLGEKAFEQAAGFLRIKGAGNPLDNSSVHPEQYRTVESIAKECQLSVKELIGNIEVLQKIENSTQLKNKIGAFTLKDIVAELKKPGIDPRLKSRVFQFTEGINGIEDLKVGMLVNGLITNVTDFGAFVNIGIKTNGLIHKTEISDAFVQHPTDYLAIDQQVQARVILIEPERNRIGLSIK